MKAIGVRPTSEIRKTIAFAFLTLLIATMFAGLVPARNVDASGESTINLGITPLEYDGDYWNLTMAAGESRTLKVEVSNRADAGVAVRTYATDVYTIVNGGFGARLDGEPVTGVTTWLAYPGQTLTLEGGTALTRSFSVLVPMNTAPGEYITSLVAQNAEPTMGGPGGLSIRQVQRSVIAVVITVPGPRKPSLAIGPFSHKYLATNSVVLAQVSNTGNVRLKPAGELVVSRLDGLELARAPFTMDTFFAGDTTDIEIPFAQPLAPGNYVVALTLNFESGTASEVSGRLTVPEPTAAEAAGAPTGSAPLPAINQPPSPGSGVNDLPLIILSSGLILAAIGLGAWIFVVRRSRSKTAAARI
ncbi:MAG: hypothetical protein ABI577_03800 [bacterium]